jgi:hypothetical protein
LADGQEIVAMDNTKLVRSDRKVFIGQIHNKKKYGRGISCFIKELLFIKMVGSMKGAIWRTRKVGKGVRCTQMEIFTSGNITRTRSTGKEHFFGSVFATVLE